MLGLLLVLAAPYTGHAHRDDHVHAGVAHDDAAGGTAPHAHAPDEHPVSPPVDADVALRDAAAGASNDGADGNPHAWHWHPAAVSPFALPGPPLALLSCPPVARWFGAVTAVGAPSAAPAPPYRPPIA